jgi:hypothetical protein
MLENVNNNLHLFDSTWFFHSRADCFCFSTLKQIFVLTKLTVGWCAFSCRPSLKPPMGKVNKKDQRKRGPSVTDGLDPMDPSSYSDAPRGGWYSLSTELTNPHLKLSLG